MTNKEKRQMKLLEVLKHQGTGVVSVTDEQLGALLSVSPKTVNRDLTEMHDRSLIVKETKLLTINGMIFTHRDIILNDETKRKFSSTNHRNLMDFSNHKVVWEEEWVWYRRPNGVDWERNMPDKEFESAEQIWSWIYGITTVHHKNWKEGDKYISRN